METLAKICVLFIISMFIIMGIAGLVIWCVTGTWWNGMMGAIALVVAGVELRNFKKECFNQE